MYPVAMWLKDWCLYDSTVSTYTVAHHSILKQETVHHYIMKQEQVDKLCEWLIQISIHAVERAYGQIVMSLALTM